MEEIVFLLRSQGDSMRSFVPGGPPKALGGDYQDLFCIYIGFLHFNFED